MSSTTDIMPPQLRAAWDALAACATPREVAALLSRHGIKGDKANCLRCPLAIYFQRVGGCSIATVADTLIWDHPGSPLSMTVSELPAVARQFWRENDRGFFPDLIAEAIFTAPSPNG